MSEITQEDLSAKEELEETKLLARWLIDNSSYYFDLACEEANRLICEKPEYYLTGQYRLVDKQSSSLGAPDNATITKALRRLGYERKIKQS